MTAKLLVAGDLRATPAEDLLGGRVSVTDLEIEVQAILVVFGFGYFLEGKARSVFRFGKKYELVVDALHDLCAQQA